MQALYHLPSLGQRVDLSIVYMEFHAKAPATLINSGDRGKLLDSFCAFQTKLNKPSDNDAEHWDMALLLSGLDFYAIEGGKNNYVTMGTYFSKITLILLQTYLFSSPKVCQLSLEFALTFTTASSENLVSRINRVNRILPLDSLPFT
jgi:hypothetical protein